MALPVPNLDDRRFQELVDESKRRVQQHCPEWSDHNVHDPGVTLIELFSWMTELVIYRLNRVPDKLYVKFLELLGVRLFPPTPARAPVTFWLSAPQPETVRIPRGTEVATLRTQTDEAIIFSTEDDLNLVACAFLACASWAEGETLVPRTESLQQGESFLCFSPVPRPGDAFLIGLSDAVPSCAVTVRLDCKVEGVGVVPVNPPLVWEAFDGENWLPCEVDSDRTAGLNQAGDVVLHVPASHKPAVLGQQRAGWLRARVTVAEEHQPRYAASPTITQISAFTCGGTVDAIHAQMVLGETVGVSEGVPGQSFLLQRQPVVAEGPVVLEVSEGEGWQEWKQVPHFAGSKADDPHFTLDPVAGELALGPAVREPDGTLRAYGRVPAKGAHLRLRSYYTGGGSEGNVARNALRVMKSSIPYVASVENRRAAAGGLDGEDIENAKVRGPIELRTRSRAVTPEDFEQLAREAAPEIARVRCLAAGEGVDAGSVRVLVVPSVASIGGSLDLEQLAPPAQTVEKIGRRLDECRLVGSRVLIEPPRYHGLTVVTLLRARPHANSKRLHEQVLEALYTHFNPIVGGPDGQGWPFGRPVHVGEIYSVLQRIRGIDVIEELRLFEADLGRGTQNEVRDHVELMPDELVFSFEHQVRVEEGR